MDAGRVAVLVIVVGALGLGGCLASEDPRPPVNVTVETAYEPEVADTQAGREKGDELGFDRGDPASQGDAYLLLHVSSRPRHWDTIIDPYDNATRNATLDGGDHRIPLDPNGAAAFRVDLEDPAYVSIGLDGTPSPNASDDCRTVYRGGTGFLQLGPERDPPPTENGFLGPLNRAVDVILPFAIRC